MIAGITIRPCRTEECANVLDLWQKAEATPGVTDSVQELKTLIQAHGDLFLVSEHNGQLLGTVIGGWDGWRGNIYRLAVLPDQRRQGIGRALVKEIDRRLYDKGAKRLSILVEREHSLAVSFWDSLISLDIEVDSRIVRYIKTL